MTAPQLIPLEGHCHSGLQTIRSAFAQTLTTDGGRGASLAVVRKGELIVDLWGGFQDKVARQPWQSDSLSCVYSTGKAVMAMLVAEAVAEGLLDYREKVAAYWPEFSQAGKAEIDLFTLLSHQGGLCGFVDEFDPARWLDWSATVAALATMEPLWPPGTANGYHPQTFGYLAGELVRRVRGKSVGQVLRDHDLNQGGDIICGLRDEEMSRSAYMMKPSTPPVLGEINEFTRLAFLTRWASPAGVAREQWAAAEIPASNMHANGRGLAMMLAPLVMEAGDAGALDRSVRGDMFAEQCCRDDLVLPFTLSWAAGMMRNNNGVYGPNPQTLGHSGFGGSCVLVDPEMGLVIAYVPSKMSPALIGDDRAILLIEAIYESL